MALVLVLVTVAVGVGVSDIVFVTLGVLVLEGVLVAVGVVDTQTPSTLASAPSTLLTTLKKEDELVPLTLEINNSVAEVPNSEFNSAKVQAVPVLFLYKISFNSIG